MNVSKNLGLKHQSFQFPYDCPVFPLIYQIDSFSFEEFRTDLCVCSGIWVTDRGATILSEVGTIIAVPEM